MTAVAAMRQELDRLADAGGRLGFWWRDDDATRASPALDQLLAISRASGIPVSLAVVPAHAETGLAERLRDEDDVTVLVHGWRHANHALPAEAKSEFGRSRSEVEAADDAAAGLGTILDRFGTRARAVFAPPWNRIAPEHGRRLPALGYRALSCFGERPETPGIVRIDTHLDPVDWRGVRSLAEPEALVLMMRNALARGARTLGFLTHHAMFDAPLWAFCESLTAMAADHPALRPESIDGCLAAYASVEGAAA